MLPLLAAFFRDLDRYVQKTPPPTLAAFATRLHTKAFDLLGAVLPAGAAYATLLIARSAASDEGALTVIAHLPAGSEPPLVPHDVLLQPLAARSLTAAADARPWWRATPIAADPLFLVAVFDAPPEGASDLSALWDLLGQAGTQLAQQRGKRDVLGALQTAATALSNGTFDRTDAVLAHVRDDALAVMRALG